MSRSVVLSTPPAKAAYALSSALAWWDFSDAAKYDNGNQYPSYGTGVDTDLDGNCYLYDFTSIRSTVGGKTVVTPDGSDGGYLYTHGNAIYRPGPAEYVAAVNLLSFPATSFEFASIGGSNDGSLLGVKIGGTFYFAQAFFLGSDFAYRLTSTAIALGKQVWDFRVDGANSQLYVNGVSCPWSAGALFALPGEAPYDWATGMPTGINAVSGDNIYPFNGAGYSDTWTIPGATTPLTSGEINIYQCGITSVLTTGQRQTLHALVKPA